MLWFFIYNVVWHLLNLKLRFIQRAWHGRRYDLAQIWPKSPPSLISNKPIKPNQNFCQLSSYISNRRSGMKMFLMNPATGTLNPKCFKMADSQPMFISWARHVRAKFASNREQTNKNFHIYTYPYLMGPCLCISLRMIIRIKEQISRFAT